jgi:hypothetical protein
MGLLFIAALIIVKEGLIANTRMLTFAEMCFLFYFLVISLRLGKVGGDISFVPFYIHFDMNTEKTTCRPRGARGFEFRPDSGDPGHPRRAC